MIILNISLQNTVIPMTRETLERHQIIVILRTRRGLVTVLCRSSERFKLVSGDRRNHEAYGRFQARGRKDCVEQWVVTHACCGRSGYWQIHSGEMDSELSSGRAGMNGQSRGCAKSCGSLHGGTGPGHPDRPASANVPI